MFSEWNSKHWHNVGHFYERINSQQWQAWEGKIQDRIYMIYISYSINEKELTMLHYWLVWWVMGHITARVSKSWDTSQHECRGHGAHHSTSVEVMGHITAQVSRSWATARVSSMWGHCTSACNRADPIHDSYGVSYSQPPNTWQLWCVLQPTTQYMTAIVGPSANHPIHDSYSVLPIYRGRVYRGIVYNTVTYWTPFFGAQEHDIFREMAVFPWTQLRETIFREICSPWSPLFSARGRQFFAKPTLAYLSMRAGTHAVRWSAMPGGALTPPLCRRVGSS